jgi:mannose-6-phosphate isomerase-like protein (cupin superfamily)
VRTGRVLVPLLVALAACSSQKDEQKPAALAQRQERPFNSHFDALEKLYLPGAQFPPGVRVVSAPIHSTATTTLFFVALRDTIAPYVNPAREETLFIVKGSGTLQLANGKAKAIEGGYVVRVPPGFAHGLTSSPNDPLEAIVVVTPAVVAQKDEPETRWSRPAMRDDPSAFGSVYCEDVTTPNAIETPPDPNPKNPAHFKTAKFLQQSKQSTLQIAAVQLDRIPEHRHLEHDETVILFFQMGFGFLRLDGVIDPVEAVQVSCIPAGTLHSYEHKANGQARAISIFTPGYDGKDVVLVEENNEVQPPPGWKKTRQDEFQEPGYHARTGDSVPGKPATNDPINIGNTPSGR